MGFLNKAESLKLAQELGIENAEEMSWTDLQVALAAAQKPKLEVDPASAANDEVVFYIPDNKQDKQENENTRKLREHLKSHSVPMPNNLNSDPMAQYYGKNIMLAPELPPERYRLIKYDEELGNEMDIEERQFDMNMATDQVFDKSGGEIDFSKRAGKSSDAYMDYTTGTYRIKGHNERKVVAMSSVPKENYGLGIEAGVDYFPIVTWAGRAGYLWTHPTYPNVKAMLMESGYYHEYKDKFQREPNIWYVAGKTLACDIGLVKAIMQEIEAKEQKKLREEEAYRKSIGL